MIFLKKYKLIFLVLLFTVFLSWFFWPEIKHNYIWHKTAKATSVMPWYDGGKILDVSKSKMCMFDQPCPSGTPGPCPPCPISCPLLSAAIGPGCAKYEKELKVSGQFNTTVIGVLPGFNYSGGGNQPMPGMDFLAGGSSPLFPTVIGIPGLAKEDSRFKKVTDFIIAIFKN